MFSVAYVDRELIDDDLNQKQCLYYVSQRFFAYRRRVTCPTDDECAIIKPQLSLVLTDPEPNSQEGTCH